MYILHPCRIQFISLPIIHLLIRQFQINVLFFRDLREV